MCVDATVVNTISISLIHVSFIRKYVYIFWSIDTKWHKILSIAEFIAAFGP